jgi:hypothetical protein
MADMTAIAGALTSIQTVLALLKNANDGHLAMQISAEIANVQSKLIDVQQQALTLLDSNQNCVLNSINIKPSHSTIPSYGGNAMTVGRRPVLSRVLG